jgi:uncharacterized protein
MFGNAMILIITFVHVYVVWRLASTPWVVRAVPRTVLFVMVAVLWLSFVLARVYGHHGEGRLAVIIEFIGMNWAAVLLLLFLCLLVADIITGFGLLWPKLSGPIRNAAVVAGLGMAAIGFVQGMRPPVVETYEVRMPGLPANLDKTTVVALADLHLGSQIGCDWLAKRVAQVQALKPDMIVLLGDVFEGHGTPDPECLSLLRSLSAPLGEWAVLGNHEFYGSEPVGEGPLLEAGFKVLRDQWVEIGPGLILTGVDDVTGHRRAGIGEGYVTKALQGRPPGPTILLSHTPKEPQEAMARGVNLVLNGHTHGGQIWPLGYLSASKYPFVAGRYDVGDMTVIVSRGAGTWGPRMRLWKPGDIVRVILRAE